MDSTKPQHLVKKSKHTPLWVLIALVITIVLGMGISKRRPTPHPVNPQLGYTSEQYVLVAPVRYEMDKTFKFSFMKKDNDKYLYQANADSTDSIIVLIDKNNETYPVTRLNITKTTIHRNPGVEIRATIAVGESETLTVKNKYSVNTKEDIYPPIDWSLSNNQVYMTIYTTESVKDRQ